MSESFYQVIARYEPKTGEMERVLTLLAELTADSLAERDCLSFEYFRGVENDREILILEVFTDAAGFAAHRETEHFTRIGVSSILPLLEKRSSTKMIVTPT